MQKQIIEFLKETDNYISGEEISQSLKISRAGIWKYMQELRQLGYEIVAVPHLGYKLLSLPDKLFPNEIQDGLKAKILGKKIVYEETVSSTMDVACQLAMAGEPEGMVVCCETQTKGRGRLGRTWQSPKEKGLYFSFILRPQCSLSDVAKLTLLSAVALAEAVRHCTGVEVAIKWPNDIMVQRKKMAGILTELNAEMERIKFVVVGVGLNVNTLGSSLPPYATSIKQETKKDQSRVKLLQEILWRMEQWYGIFQRQGFEPIVVRWKELSVTLNQRVRVSDPAGTVEGEAIDIDQDGGLLIRQDSGVVIKRLAGDVLLAH